MTPVPCQHCGGAVVETEIGWTHVDGRGVLVGWLCPMPCMTLATPASEGQPSQRPAEPVAPPAWLAAMQIPMSAQHRAP
jgi:hypothetical protein